MSQLCTRCGSQYESRSNGGSVQKFCSKDCRQDFNTACRIWAAQEYDAERVSTETAFQKVIPLIEAVTDGFKEMAREGEIGPSSIAALRNWYDDHAEDGEGEIFAHIGLPRDCAWEAFRRHYTTRKRIDHTRAADDFCSFPPIVARLKELKKEAA